MYIAENIRLLKKEKELWYAVVQRHLSAETMQKYEELSQWDENEEMWTLPKDLVDGQGSNSQNTLHSEDASDGRNSGAKSRGKQKSSNESHRRSGKENRGDNKMPPSDIGGMSPTTGDAEFHNEILGGGSSDDEMIPPTIGDINCGSGRQSSTEQEYEDPVVGKYFSDQADVQRQNAGRRVLADASALKNEMMDLFNGNIGMSVLFYLAHLHLTQQLLPVLWGAGEGPQGPAAPAVRKAKENDLGPRRAPHRLGAGLGPASRPKASNLGETFMLQFLDTRIRQQSASCAALPLPGRGGFLDDLADKAAESKIAADAARFNQQQVCPGYTFVTQ